MEFTRDKNEMKGRIVHIRNFDRLNYVIKSPFCNMKQATEVLPLLGPVISAYEENFE